MNKPTTEIELKFLVDDAAERRLRRSMQLGDIEVSPATTGTLVTVYYDTPERRLQEAGIALRLRRKGRTWTQTLKAGRTIRAGLSSAIELDCPAPGGRLALDAIPDEDLREEVKARIGGGALSPVLETDIKRTARRLTVPEMGEVELAIDVGEIRAGDRSAHLCEVEIELLTGQPQAVFEVARRLLQQGGMRFSTLSKAERGALLADKGVIEPTALPRLAKTVSLSAEMTTESGAREVLGECLEQIQTNIAAIGATDDPEGPHQLRIGLRRLRTALWVFAEALESEALRHLQGEARWLGQEVGRLRDLEVTLTEIVIPDAERSADQGFGRLSGALATAIEEERARLRAVLQDERAATFLLDVAAFITTRAWLSPQDYAQTQRLARPLGKTAAEALDKALSRAAKRARGIATLSIPERHDLRKSLKRLRYAVEFMAPIYPAKRVKPFLRRLKALQVIFGDLNDAAMAEELFCAADAPAAADPSAARAAGRVIGARDAHADHAWDMAKARWRDFTRTEPFWRGG